MQLFNAMSIRNKIITILIIVTGALALLNVSIQAYVDYRQEIHNVNKHARVHVHSLTYPIAESLWDLDLSQLQQLMLSISEDDYIRNIRLTGVDGTYLDANLSPNIKTNPSILELRYNGRYLGNISYMIDDEIIQEEVISKLALGLLLNIIEAVIILVVILYIVRKLITTPLLDLYRLSKDISPRTSSKVKLPQDLTERTDELSYVAHALQNLNNTSRNAIAAQKKTERQLLQHQNQLKHSIERQTEAYKAQSKLHRILADMSLNILTCNEDNVTEVMYSAFEPIGRVLEIDRISILSIQEQMATFSYSWRADGSKNPLGEGFNIEAMTLLQRRLLSLDPIIIDDIESIEESAQTEYTLLKSQNIASIALFPLIDGQSVFGILSASNLYHPQQWTETQKTILSRLSTTISELHIRLKNHNEMTALQDELIETNRRLHIAAETDELTGLPNRRPFMTELAHNTESLFVSTITTMMIDVDHFKQYNDTYGHVQGDFALRYVAQALKQVLSPCGHMVARIGGEEFCALLINTSQEESVVLAQQMRQEVEKLNITHSGNDPYDIVTISIGVAFQHLGNHPITPQNMLENADEALYAAKKRGRNHVEIAAGTKW
ncbi:GGDEF domain-containing protein [Vibrio mediterranei]|uniref:GGDEF domain-containing protein n=1 Tax=Vibrio mediterranei TaxID=689 RepID=UPI004069902E